MLSEILPLGKTRFFFLLLPLADTCINSASLLQFSVTLTYTDSWRTKFSIVRHQVNSNNVRKFCAVGVWRILFLFVGREEKYYQFTAICYAVMVHPKPPRRIDVLRLKVRTCMTCML